MNPKYQVADSQGTCWITRFATDSIVDAVHYRQLHSNDYIFVAEPDGDDVMWRSLPDQEIKELLLYEASHGNISAAELLVRDRPVGDIGGFLAAFKEMFPQEKPVFAIDSPYTPIINTPVSDTSTLVMASSDSEVLARRAAAVNSFLGEGWKQKMRDQNKGEQQ